MAKTRQQQYAQQRYPVETVKRLTAQQQTVEQVECRQTNRRLQYIDKENSHIDVLFNNLQLLFPSLQ